MSPYTTPEQSTTATAPPDAVLTARAYLSRVAEPGSVPLWMLVRDVGPVEAAERVRQQRGLSERLLGETRARHASCDPVADIEAAERHGIRLVVPESDDWPHYGLVPLEHAGAARAQTFEAEPYRYSRRGEPVPPLALWASGPGNLRELGVRSVGIVGARGSTPYGEHVARTLARGLAERDVTIISGGAFGIDKAAHLGALEVYGDTVLISAGGIDRAYPPSHGTLFRQVRERGLLLSESPPGSSPQRHRFLSRNRLIASLATGSVIVEAAAVSGALNTARHSVHIGRPLMAVPGPVGSSMSAGCHVALRRADWDTTLVTSAAEVLEIIGGAGDLAPEPDRQRPRSAVPGRDRVRRVLDALDHRSRAVFDGFPVGRAVSPDQLVLASGLTASEVLRSLPVLELAGLVEQHRDGFRIRM